MKYLQIDENLAMLVDFTSLNELAKVCEVLYSSNMYDVYSSHRVIFRCIDASVTTKNDKLYGEVFPIVRRRFDLSSVRIMLVRHGEIVIFNVNGDRSDDLNLDSIRREELLVIAGERAIMQTAGVFKLPSGRFSKKFFRVGNIQDEKENIFILSFYIFPLVCDADLIICDNWSISSTVLNLCAWAGSVSGRTVQWDLLPPYSSAAHSLEENFECILDKYPLVALENICFVVSYSQSGSFVRVLMDLLKSRNINAKVVVLYASSSCEGAVVLAGGVNIDYTPSPGQDVVFPIDPNIYFPVSLVEKEVVINKQSVSAIYSFLSEYETTPVFIPHYTRKLESASTHHCLYPNFESLFKHGHYLNKMRDKLNSISSGILIVCEFPLVDLFFRDVLPKMKGYERVHIVKFPLYNNSASYDSLSLFLSGLHGETITVVSDIFSRGSQLFAIQQIFRDLGRRERVCYISLFGFNYDDYKRPRRDLSFNQDGVRHSFEVVESFDLVDWRDDECPWCREERSLQLVADNHEFARLRIDQIRSFKPESDYCLFFGPDSRSAKFLSQNSIFAPPGAPAVNLFAGVLSAKTKSLLRSTVSEAAQFNEKRVVAFEDYCNSFTDFILRAAFLRVFSASELSVKYGSAASDFNRRLSDILCVELNSAHNIHNEFILASLHGKIPEIKREWLAGYPPSLEFFDAVKNL